MNTILKHTQIQNIVRRMAYQIAETFFGENEIVLVGVAENGYILGGEIMKQLEQIGGFKITICKLNIDKKNPIGSTSCNLNSTAYRDKNLVIVDDVLNSGQTLMYAVHHFLNAPLRKCKTAVLVDRNHKNYPIKADFKGLSLSTSKHNHVEVILNKDEFSAILS